MTGLSPSPVTFNAAREAGTISRIALADIPPDCNVTPSAKR
jgi:hypothetical protein